MKSKIKWIAGLVALCLLSALAASLITAVMALRGLLGPVSRLWLPQAAGQTDTGTNLTTGSTAVTIAPTATPRPTATPASTPTPQPTVTPTPSPRLTPTVEPTPTPTVPQALENYYIWQTGTLIQNIYAATAPSVVGIRVEVPASGANPVRTNAGSGLILDEQGTLVTNAGILAIALDKQGRLLTGASIQVMVMGIQETLTARLIGRDATTGLAVLTIPVNGYVLQPAKLAESPALKVGQLVLAVGYPDMLDEQGGLFSGLISGLNRTVVLENGTAVQMIQTNAPISKICSGGPLINLLGEVIGLTNCNLAYESYDGMNYALPVDAMRAVAANLSDAGYVPGRAWLGITVLSEASFLELQYLYRFPNGLYVSSVVKDSPAYAADLRKGDVIVQLNDTEVGTGMDLSAFLQTQSVGSLLRLRVYRRLENQTLTIQVYLKELVR